MIQRTRTVVDVVRNGAPDELMGLSVAVSVLVWAVCVKLREVATLYLPAASNWRGPRIEPWVVPNVSDRPALIVSVLGISVLLLLFWLAQPAGRTSLVGVGLLTGGAAANTTERLCFGSVVDYLPVPGTEGVLANPADVIIVVGFLVFAVPLLLHYLRRAESSARRI